MADQRNKFQVGDKVVLLLENELGYKEVGVVVHYWYEPEIEHYDYYVAFFGDRIPDGKPSEKPYVLRYAETSLSLIEE